MRRRRSCPSDSASRAVRHRVVGVRVGSIGHRGRRGAAASRAADLVLAGGSDSLLTFSALAGFLRLDVMSRQTACPELASRPFDSERDGFVMAEGAGSSSCDGLVRRRPMDRACSGSCAGTRRGRRLSSCGAQRGRCRRPLVHARRPGRCGYHGHRSHSRQRSRHEHDGGDLSEGRALAALLGDHRRPVTSIKGTTGHMIGPRVRWKRSSRSDRSLHGWFRRSRACGNSTPHRSRRRPRRAANDRGGIRASNSFGFGGMNTALVLRHAGE